MKRQVSIFEMLDERPPPVPAVTAIPEASTQLVIEEASPSDTPTDQLPADAILELWQERACIIDEGNVELVQWCESQGFTPQKTWRYCELLAAGDLSMTYGTYVERVILPRLTVSD
jgi:hypothetical protein